MSLDQLRKRIQELREAGLLGSGYTAPELPGMGDPYQSQGSAKSSRNAVDNAEKLGYTPVKTTGNSNAGMQTTNVYVPNMGAALNADTAGSNNTRSNLTSGNKEIVPYQIRDSEKELNYMMDMLFMNGAGSSSVPSVQMAYDWVSNPDNKGKEIPQDVLDTYYAYMGGISDNQISRSNQIAVGKDDEVGLVNEIYEAKAANEQSTDELKPDSPYYPEAKNTSPASTSLPDLVKSADGTKQSTETVTLGKAGQTALGEIIKPNPDTFGTRSGYLYEAYQAGLDGQDFSRQLKDDAAVGNFLDEIEKMYKAGEIDAKIAEDSRSSETVPYVGADEYVPSMGYSKHGQGEDEDDILNSDRDYNYIADMMFLYGAASSIDPSVQMAYQYITNLENKGRKIPAEVMKSYGKFINDLNEESIGHQKTTQTMRDEQRRRSHKIAMGDADIDDYTYDDLKMRNDLFSSTEGQSFKYPTFDFSDVNQGYGVWYPPEKGYHMGIDVGDADGKNSNISAIYSGKVVFSGLKGKNGYMVIIEHTKNINGEEITFYSSYSHLKEKDLILKGTEVKPGDQIGIMGSTGNSTGTHLHIAVFTTTMPLDSLRPYGYGSYQISDYAWKSSSSGHTIYYNPKEVFKTNGAIIQETLNALKKKK